MTDTGSKLSLLIPLRLELVLAFPHLTSTYLSGSSADLVSSGPPHNKEPTASFPNLTVMQSLISIILILCHSMILLL